MRRFAVASSVTTLVVGLLAGCPDRSISEVNPLQGRVEAKDIPVNVNRDLDLLFLIDDSPSMSDKQNNLAANFPRFIDVLSSIPGGLPNIHIGVATSDMGTQSADGLPPGNQVDKCSGAGKDGVLQLFGAQNSVGAGDLFISDIADTAGVRTKNYTGNLSDVFGKMAKAGAGGCGFEQHLEAIKRALSNQANHGFVRPDAFLGVIIIADEDDCSMLHSSLLGSNTSLGDRQSFRCTRFGVTCDQNGQTSDAMNQVGPKNQCHPNDGSPYLTKVADYVKFLKSLKPSDPSKVVVAGIMGTVDPFAVELRSPQINTPAIPALAHSCTYIGGDNDGDGKPDPEFGDPPIRLKFFLDQFPNRNTFASICQQDLSGGLQQIGDLLRTVLGDPCIEGKLADVDPDTAGAQYDCSVSVVANAGMPTRTETLLPRCPTTGGAACWHIETDAVACPNLNKPADQRLHIVLKIDAQDTLPKDSHILANCVTEVTN